MKMQPVGHLIVNLKESEIASVVKSSNDEVEKTMLTLMTEDPFFLHDARPGWRAAYFKFNSDSHLEKDELDITIELVKFSQFAILNPFGIITKEEINNPGQKLLGYYGNYMLPLIPEDYEGKLLQEVIELRKIPGWNGVFPITLTFGTVSPRDPRTDEQIIAALRSTYFSTRQAKIDAVKLNQTIDKVFDKIGAESRIDDSPFALPSLTNNKNKMN